MVNDVMEAKILRDGVYESEGFVIQEGEHSYRIMYVQPGTNYVTFVYASLDSSDTEGGVFVSNIPDYVPIVAFVLPSADA